MNEEIHALLGRIAALEVIASTALGLYLANAPNDTGGQKADAFLQVLQEKIAQRASGLPSTAAKEAIGFGQFALSQVRENLVVLRGDPSTKH